MEAKHLQNFLNNPRSYEGFTLWKELKFKKQNSRLSYIKLLKQKVGNVTKNNFMHFIIVHGLF